VIARLIAEESRATSLADAVRGAMRQIRGAYSLAIMTETQLVGARDPYGVRPLCLGRLGNDKWVLAANLRSEHGRGDVCARHCARRDRGD
jgi:amidophosphoribosyltransferase